MMLNVLVSDIGMPQEDGYQFIHKVRMAQTEGKYQQWLLPHTEQKIVTRAVVRLPDAHCKAG